MPTLLEEEIDRVLEGSRPPARPAPAAPRTQTPTATTPPRRATKPVIRFSPMFEAPPPAAARRRRILVGASIAAHVVLATVIFLMPKSAQTIVEPSLPIQIVFTAPVPQIAETMRPPAIPKPVPKPKPRPERREEPPPPLAPAPIPLPKPVVPETAPTPVVKVEPKPQRPVVRTGLLDETPSGLTIVASKNSRALVTVPGFETAAFSGSSTARPGRVTEVAFDSAKEQARPSRGTGGVVRETGFGEEAAAAIKKPARAQPDGALDTDVEILSKVKPVYTDEARLLKIEGDVVLDVIFQASGVLTVLGLSEGLGHGLDEAAIVAARKIVFNPARRGTKPVDHTAKLRVVFRLA